MKRFSSGKLKWWPRSSNDLFSIGAKELQVLLYQGNPVRADIKPDWRPLN